MSEIQWGNKTITEPDYYWFKSPTGKEDMVHVYASPVGLCYECNGSGGLLADIPSAGYRWCRVPRPEEPYQVISDLGRSQGREWAHNPHKFCQVCRKPFVRMAYYKDDVCTCERTSL